MIYWLLDSDDAHPELAEGIAPGGLLSTAERARLESFGVAKRRHDWLLGRWTAKRLLQAIVEERAGVRLPLNALALNNGVDGAPYAFLDPSCDPGVDLKGLDSVSLSISHCGNYAFCATYPHHLFSGNGAGTDSPQLGADVERIERRYSSFVEDYFSDAEIAWLHRAPSAWYDTLVTAIWSAKESVLKALHVGLTVDTRRVSCLVSPISPGSRPWVSLDIRCDPALLVAARVRAPRFFGWWRVVDNHVLTLATVVSGDKRSPAVRPCDSPTNSTPGGNGIGRKSAIPSAGEEARPPKPARTYNLDL